MVSKTLPENRGRPAERERDFTAIGRKYAGPVCSMNDRPSARRDFAVGVGGRFFDLFKSGIADDFP